MNKYKLGFLAKNAWISLIRTPGILGTGITLWLLSAISFLFTRGLDFLASWIAFENSQPAGDSLIGVSTFDQLALLLGILRVMAGILSFATGLALISYGRRSFLQHAQSQRSDFCTMSLLGETSDMIGFEFSLSTLYALLLTIGAGFFTSASLVSRILATAAPENSYYEAAQHFAPSFRIDGIIFLLALALVPLRSFQYVRKYLDQAFEQDDQ